MKRLSVLLLLIGQLFWIGAFAQVEVVDTSDDARLIRHPGGETRVGLEPERIVTLWQPGELVALGVTPVAAWSFRSDTHPPYLADALADTAPLGSSWPPNYEAILAQQPDLILAPDYMGEFYDQLARIAPTVLIDHTNSTSWYGTFLDYGRVLGQQDEARTILAAYQAKADAARAQLDEAVGDESVMLLRVRARNFTSQERGARGITVHRDLDLAHAECIPEDSVFPDFSLEGLSACDPDHIFLQVDEDDESSERLRELRASSVWQNLRAVQAGQVYEVDYRLWINGADPLASSMVINEVLEHLVND
jgi:iron complex transport system substrate-binding protein